jgi:beta-lactamase regulating signal transducer with metallopeptidase domain
MSNMMQIILSVSISASVLALVLFLLNPVLKNKASQAFCYYLWILVLLRMAIPFGYGISFSDLAIDFQNQTASNKSSYSDNYQNVNVDTQSNVPQTSSSTSDSISEDDADDIAVLPPDNAAYCETADSSNVLDILESNWFYIWLLGVIISILWYAVAYVVFAHRILRSCSSAYKEDSIVFNEMAGNRKVRLVCSDYTNTPMLMGVFRPVIVLPKLAYMANGMKQELKNILSHELIHDRRHDTLYKWFAVVVTSLHWFNPLVYLVRKEISLACELSCDEAVIQHMSPAERKDYGNTLLALAGNKRLSAGIMATTLCEEKKELKRRLINIMNYKKKSGLAVALMVLVALFLTACTSVMLQPSKGVENNQPDALDVVNISHPINDGEIVLKHLAASDLYPNGQVFESVPESFISAFQSKMTTLSVPDARRGERAVDINAGRESWQNHDIILLNAMPEKNIYVYGYNDSDPNYFGLGLILDVGTEQTLYTFPFRYMTNTVIPPDIGIDEDNNELYLSVKVGTGTGTSISELYVFPFNNINKPYYLDTNTLVDVLNTKLSMSYSPESKTIHLYWDGIQIAESGFSAIGAAQGEEHIPESFYLGNLVSYAFSNNKVETILQPTIYFENQPGVQGTLNSVKQLECAIDFRRDDNGLIVGFDIGKATSIA